MSYTVGSLFDGSGGFPLSGAMCDFRTIWASEVEPYPIAVTKSRFPNMKHLGDIGKINGAEVEPVDIITFGSPCQGLSVAGFQKGLDDKRSALFMEAIRIIKEMREATNGKYPRFAVWENVPGAFSSNKGEDFRIVLEELIKIVEPNAVMPEVPKKGWAYADSYRGNGWSLAYRVLDAQYIRTAQRRRRIYLILCLTDECAGEILFKREGLQRYFEKSGTPWQRVTAETERSVGADGCKRECVGVDVYNQALTDNKAKTINCAASDADHIPCTICSVENHPADSRVTLDKSGKVQTLTSRMGTGGGNVPMVMETFCKSTRARTAEDATTWKHADVANTLNTFDQGEARANELVVYCLQGNGIDRADTAGCNGKGWREDASYTLNTIDRPAIVYAMDRASFNQGENAQFDFEITDSGVNSTLVAKGPSAVCYWDGTQTAGTLTAQNADGSQRMPDKTNFNCVVENGTRYIVRRLTPTECARLQGFPDDWGRIEPKTDFTDEEYKFWLEVRNTYAEINGKQIKDHTKKQMLAWYNKLHSDSSEYKMWGNGIALPCALYVMEGIANTLKGENNLWQTH